MTRSRQVIALCIVGLAVFLVLHRACASIGAESGQVLSAHALDAVRGAKDCDDATWSEACTDDVFCSANEYELDCFGSCFKATSPGVSTRCYTEKPYTVYGCERYTIEGGCGNLVVDASCKWVQTEVGGRCTCDGGTETSLMWPRYAITLKATDCDVVD